jgi:hypothetical protein
MASVIGRYLGAEDTGNDLIVTGVLTFNYTRKLIIAPQHAKFFSNLVLHIFNSQ